MADDGRQRRVLGVGEGENVAVVVHDLDAN
jgi:hypothetical protein